MKKITDTNRMNWLHKVLEKSKKNSDSLTWKFCFEREPISKNITLRKAIDAAIRAERGGKRG